MANITRSVIKEEKIMLRKHYRQLLAAMTPMEKSTASLKCQSFLTDYLIKHYPPGKLILSYASNPRLNEIDLNPINQYLANNKQLVLPRISSTSQNLDCYLLPELSAKYLTSRQITRTINILEPNIETCKLVDPQKISLVIVPGLAFEINDQESYYRLGRGGGYYDRLLAQLRSSLRISVGYLIQGHQENKLPVDEYDQPVDQVYLF